MGARMDGMGKCIKIWAIFKKPVMMEIGEKMGKIGLELRGFQTLRKSKKYFCVCNFSNVAKICIFP